MSERESFASRMGFMLSAAGCAIGLGNVWRFPFIVGEYGGALFVLIYLAFLVLLGLPLLTMELAVGRASRSSLAWSFEKLEVKGSRWHFNKYWMIAGNYVLMSFYTVVTGWMLLYCVRGFSGEFTGDLAAADTGAAFGAMLADPVEMFIYMMIVTVLGFLICSGGLRGGVERVIKPVMALLLLLLIFLAGHSVVLPGFKEGLSFYLYPSLEHLNAHPLSEVLSAAMAQAFFTLSIGVGAIQIFGSYTGNGYRLSSEALRITLLDTLVALLSGFIIFPACFSYGVEPGEGAGLIFVTLVSIFSHLDHGSLWGGLFFLFMTCAALSTLVAVFENIIAITMELTGMGRRAAVGLNFVVISLLSLPCLLGFNVLKDVHPLGGESSFLDLEDFLVSDNILPLGALIYVLFVVRAGGWGFAGYLKECNRGAGLAMPAWVRGYFTYILPPVIALLILNCYLVKWG